MVNLLVSESLPIEAGLDCAPDWMIDLDDDVADLWRDEEPAWLDPRLSMARHPIGEVGE